MSGSRPAVLVIAGSDSSGGAGLLRDVQTLTACDVEVLCAITAITAQTHTRVSAVQYASAELVRQQISDAFDSRRIDAVKIGMLGNAAIVQVVAQTLGAVQDVPIVLDPVVLSSSGGELLDTAGIQLLLETLLPLTALVTPNVPELARLTKSSLAHDLAELRSQARALLQLGAKAVLVKGGHASGNEAVDVLMTADTMHSFAAPRVPRQRRGTGCTLAACIAAQLAKGMSLPSACEYAKQYVLGYLSGT